MKINECECKEELCKTENEKDCNHLDYLPTGASVCTLFHERVFRCDSGFLKKCDQCISKKNHKIE